VATKTALIDLADRFAESLNGRDVTERDLLSDDYINHDPYVEAGPAGSASFFEQLLQALPDIQVVCEDAIAVGTLEEGTVVGRYTYMGTFSNSLLGFAPTGKRIVMRSIDIWRVRNGKFAEHWDELNTADFFAQLQGAEPQARSGAATP
jgi:predicted SnoaL-like aldol condensation-catalyzing enzyme